MTRSLGRQGITVTVGDERLRSLAGASRYCRGLLLCPSPKRDAEPFVEAIYREVRGGRYRVVFPTDDVSLWLLGEARARFEGLAELPIPDIEAVQVAHDKAAVVSLAQEQGIPVPRTAIARSPGELRSMVQVLGLPAVVKPRFSWYRLDGKWIQGIGTLYVRSAEELEVAWQRVHQVIPFPLVQEYIPGEGRGLSLLMKHGEPRAAFSHRRIREKPPTGGVSVVSESIPLDSRMLRDSARLLERLKWHGVAMMEFKHDTRDGVPKLLEINGRFWGSLQLAMDAGVDFPYLLYRLAVDGEIAPVFSYKTGVRLRWWLGNLDWLLLRLRHGNGAATRLNALWEFMEPYGNMTRSEVFRRDDPQPALEELRQYLGQTVRERIVRARRVACDG